MQTVYAHLRSTEEKFIRYEIDKKFVPNKYKTPYIFDPQVNKIELAKLIFNEFNELILSYLLNETKNIIKEDIFKIIRREKRFKDKIFQIYENLKIRYKALFDRPCEYGVFSGILGGFLPKKEKCTGCLRCWQEYPKVVKVYYNKEYLKLEESLNFLGLKLNEFYMLLYEAETGNELVKGMGYKGPQAGGFWDGIWLDMSEIVRPTRDGKEGREYISTVVNIGRKLRYFDPNKRNNVFSIQIPIFFDYMENYDYKIVKSVALAAKECFTFAILPIKYYKSLKLENIVPLIKVKEIEEIKNINVIEILFEDNLNEIEKIREKHEDKIIIVRIKSDKYLENNVLNLYKTGIDAIHIEFEINGSDFTEEKNNAKYIIRKIHNLLVKKGIRNEISLLGSGGINLAEHVVKAMICGLDCVGINSVIHLALQSKMEIKNGKITIKPRKIELDWGKQRLMNILAAWHEQIIEALSAMGKRDVRRLRGDVGRAIFYEEIRKEAFADIKKAF